MSEIQNSMEFVRLYCTFPPLLRFRRLADQQLRQDQDQAYEESLAADREKERKRMEAQQMEETKARQHREKEIKEEKRKEVRYAMLLLLC